MNLSDIIRADAAYVTASGFTVSCDSAYSTVAITEGRTGECVFMQGDEADAFNDECETLHTRTGDTTMDECAAHLARPYVESLV